MNIPKSFNNWLEDNYNELQEMAFDADCKLHFVATEKYQEYLESIYDRDN